MQRCEMANGKEKKEKKEKWNRRSAARRVQGTSKNNFASEIRDGRRDLVPQVRAD